MAFVHDPGTSYSRLRRYASQVSGGLKARASLEAELPAWSAISKRIDGERAARGAADDVLLEAATQVRVADVEFDTAVGVVSGHAFLLAGKQADREPYRTLFGGISAAQAKDLGMAKATEVGLRIVRDGRRLELPALAEPLAALEAATSALRAASDAYAAAEDALFGPRQAKIKLVRDLNALIALTEARILLAFPGRDDLTRAILRPWYERRRTSAAAQDVGPEVEGEADAPEV